MIEGLIVRYEPWVLALIMLSLVIFFPLGLIFLCFRKVRRMGVVFLGVSHLFFLIFLRDVRANLRGCRPWVPSFDDVFPLFWGMRNFNHNIVSIPFDTDRMEFEVSFARRGEYHFGMRTSECLKENFVIPEEIHIQCAFFDENGVEVFCCRDDPFFSRIWMQSKNAQGSSIYYGRFHVPKDLQYDRKFRALVDVNGDTEAFRKHYQNVRFTIVKSAHK